MERVRINRSPPPAEDLENGVEEVRNNDPATDEVSRRKLRGTSKLTNGLMLLPGVDGRSTWSRRLRDLYRLYLEDMGGEDAASESQRSLARRAALLTTEAERLEARFAEAEGVGPSELDLYIRTTSLLHRLLASLGLEKGASSSTPARHADPVTNELIQAIREGRGLT